MRTQMSETNIKSASLVFAFIVALSVSFVVCQVPDGSYRVANVGDGLHLTIQGVNDSYAAVVSDTWFNYADQIWKFRHTKNKYYHITPKRYESNNVLSYHFDLGRRYAQAVSWRLHELKSPGHPIYQLLNERTRECLTSFGRRNSVNETRCDKYVRSQQWQLYKIR